VEAKLVTPTGLALSIATEFIAACHWDAEAASKIQIRLDSS